MCSGDSPKRLSQGYSCHCSIALIGQAVHKVDADVVESGAPDLFKGCNGLLRRVPSSQELQEPVVQTLHAHAQAVYAGVQEGRQVAVEQVSGVGLNGDLCVRLRRERRRRVASIMSAMACLGT